MMGTYLRLAARHFWKHRALSWINVTGLTVGLATAVGLGLYIQFELSYDRYHSHADRIYRAFNKSQRDGKDLFYAQVPGPLAAFLRMEYPEIEATARVVPVARTLVSSADRHFYEDGLILADPSVLDVFTFPLVRGNPSTSLEAPNSVLITEPTARKYFGDADPIGRTVRVDRRTDLTVTGILQDIPRNSHFRFGLLASTAGADAIFSKGFLDNRVNTIAYTYVRLRAGVGQAPMENKMSGAGEGYFGDSSGTWGEFGLQPITRIHLHSQMGGEFEPNASVQTVYILGAIACLVVLVACINCVSLTIGLYSRRTREIGTRRVAGADRRQIVGMLLCESLLTAFLSLLLALLVTDALLPRFSQFVDLPLGLLHLGVSEVVSLIVLAALIGLASGMYPALVASGMAPVVALKTRRSGPGRVGLQHGLLVVQFAVLITLVICTITVERQVRLIRGKNLGFLKEALVTIPLQDRDLRKKTEVLKKELLRSPDILSAAASSDLPGAMKWVTSIHYEGAPSGGMSPTMSFLKVDRDFVRTYDLQIVKGRDLSGEAASGTGHEYLLNEAAARRLGWREPVGKQFGSYHGGEGQVVGVVKDSNFKSLHVAIEPLFLSPAAGSFSYLTVRINTSDVGRTVAFMKEIWSKLSPDSPFQFYFYDAFLDRLYTAEAMLGRVTLTFSGLTVLIACYGLLGLTAMAAQQRVRETGIRKVLGATVPGVVWLLARGFALKVALANVLAWPVAWLVMHRWLEDFAYRVNLSTGTFVLGGTLALAVAMATVSTQALRAAAANPADTLRCE